jgi:hypothetical protein
MGKKRIAKSELNRLKRFWRDEVRELIKGLPCPPNGPDAIACFDALLAEVQIGRKIASALSSKVVA